MKDKHVNKARCDYLRHGWDTRDQQTLGSGHINPMKMMTIGAVRGNLCGQVSTGGMGDV